MMGPRVPVEIWQKILRHAMYIPVFFDIDPIETYGIQAMPYFGDEEPYWETERVKSVLKRMSCIRSSQSPPCVEQSEFQSYAAGMRGAQLEKLFLPVSRVSNFGRRIECHRLRSRSFRARDQRRGE
ncbi:hypothetical protein PIIN_11377 [Serendipita indica DSM 11827]|uniref:Uncharacterized protein n=1 Tax=Serendipita indica (strain DSM 11827) TaxID=1109443 RepID=G4U1F7_SERID|nr:hypothetical protein PIIN_11377 [Serendipita indica DSM 11827]